MDAFENVRRQFPVCQSSTYLDCAYDCGGSLFSRASAEEYYNDWHKRRKRAKGRPRQAALFRQGRGLKAENMHPYRRPKPREVCFTRNTNEGITISSWASRGSGRARRS